MAVYRDKRIKHRLLVWGSAGMSLIWFFPAVTHYTFPNDWKDAWWAIPFVVTSIIGAAIISGLFVRAVIDYVNRAD